MILIVNARIFIPDRLQSKSWIEAVLGQGLGP